MDAGDASGLGTDDYCDDGDGEDLDVFGDEERRGGEREGEVRQEEAAKGVGIMVADGHGDLSRFPRRRLKVSNGFWQNLPPKYATNAVMNQGRNKYAPVSDTEKPKLPCM